jgi:hypothetical protein
MMPFLYACTDAARVTDESSRKFDLPADAVLVLNTDLNIPPNKARIYFQYGSLVSMSEIDQYYPHCEFQIKTLSDSTQTVVADRFKITREVNEIFYSSKGGSAFPFALTSNMFDYSSMVEYVTHWYLASDKQPDVYRMNCLMWGEANDPEYPTVTDIRAALGEYFTLEFNKSYKSLRN